MYSVGTVYCTMYKSRDRSKERGLFVLTSKLVSLLVSLPSLVAIKYHLAASNNRELQGQGNQCQTPGVKFEE